MIDVISRVLFEFMGIWTFIKSMIPLPLTYFLNAKLQELHRSWNMECYVNLPQCKDKEGFLPNELYNDGKLYLEKIQNHFHGRYISVFRPRNSTDIGIDTDPCDGIPDTFQGMEIWWFESTQEVSLNNYERQTKRRPILTLKLTKTNKQFLLAYFKHIKRCAAEIKIQKRNLKLFTNDGIHWKGIAFKHPSTLNTLALEPSLKATIIEDLNGFKESKEFYRRIGRAWKRGYLLYGPPGTGKSSLIAAIANYMKYDIYDLELTHVNDNLALRSLLTRTSEKSIIIIEDIDCSLKLKNREVKEDVREEEPSCYSIEETEDSDENDSLPLRGRVTLSGLLNFTDGLWSCCGDERIIIFTTNHKDHIDPALLRCGRMDMHILLSFCNFPVFKILAKNYLNIVDHPLYCDIEKRMATGTELTPAQIIEVLMSKLSDPNEALSAVVSALDTNISEIAARWLTQVSQTDRQNKDYVHPNEEEETLSTQGRDDHSDHPTESALDKETIE